MMANSKRAAVLAGLGITQGAVLAFLRPTYAPETVRRILRDREPARIPISAVRPRVPPSAQQSRRVC